MQNQHERKGVHPTQAGSPAMCECPGRAARRAVHLPIFQSRNRNWRLRLLFSMTSSSVTVTKPPPPLRDAHAGQRLEKLAAQRARAHQEHAQGLQLALHAAAKHRDLPVVAAALRGQRMRTEVCQEAALACTLRLNSTSAASTSSTFPRCRVTSAQACGQAHVLKMRPLVIMCLCSNHHAHAGSVSQC